MGRTKLQISACCDPFESRKKIHKISKRQKFDIKKISPALLISFQEYFPELGLNSDSQICLYCRCLSYRKLKALQSAATEENEGILENDTISAIVPNLSDNNEQTPDNNRNQKSTTLQSCISGPSPTEIQVVDINQQFKSLLKTPLRVSDKRKPRRLQIKWQEIRNNLKNQFGQFTGGPIPTETCNHCDKLFDELSKKFESLKLKKEKYLCLTSVPRRFGETEIFNKFKNCTVYQTRYVFFIFILCYIYVHI
jgi:hypothetical protein